jgi:acyl-CoA synthetase (AMP-forming)/AMP-acid ligase II
MRAPVFDRIHDYVEFWARRAPEREAAVMGGLRLTYAQLADTVHREACALWELGARPGDRIAVLAPPRPEFFATFLAIASLGAAYHGLSPKSAQPELEYQLRDAAPRLLIWHGSEDNGELAAAMARRLDGAPAIVSGHDLAAVRPRAGVPSAVSEAAAAVTRTDSAALVDTSGSSGRPKGAMLPHLGFTRCSVAGVLVRRAGPTAAR